MRTIFAMCAFPCLFAGLLTQAGGNGGGYLHGVKFTGALAPFEPSGVEQVQIMDEKLDIQIDDHGADVQVRYLMENISGKRAAVTFGFPIEARNLGPADFASSKTEVVWKRSKKELATLTVAAGRFCSDYSVEIDGQLIGHEDVVEPYATGAVESFRGSEALEGLVGWKVSSVKFAAGEQRQITIRYRAEHERGGTTISNRSSNRAPVFRYRLSTGGVWAGPIASGRVEVKFVGANAKWCEIKQPTRRFRRLFKKEGDSMVWEFKDLEPTLADDLEIVAGPSTTRHSVRRSPATLGRQAFINTGGQWQYLHQDFKAVASSTLAAAEPYTYGAENVIGRSRVGEVSYRAWSEGVPGDGIGESITLAVEKPLPLDALEIHPGFGQSERLFRANARPAELRVTLNGEHSFTASIQDRNQSQTVPIPGYQNPVETIRLEIAKVYPGSKFTDTCISDIALVARLDKKPELKGSR